ncbi:MAG: exo-alpha-sialidase [Akkermansiaceae bacterium]|nr:exo-alpha-sialidase [Akkermansiaceae bacterium]
MDFRFSAALVLAATLCSANGEAVAVFTAGDDGYHSFRIPAAIMAKDGSLLAFCEARKNNRRDHGDIDLVMKRSTDHGLTWSSLRMIHDGGGNAEITMGNPVPVMDAGSGTVHLVFCRNNSEVLHISSNDNGGTWSAPVEITSGLKKEGWGWYATGPCHGIQLSSGKQKGRLVIPANHRQGVPGDDKGTYGSHVIHSDDAGKTWNLGAINGEADGIHPNETTAVELPPAEDGGSRILFNTRNNRGTNPLGRASAISRDGGVTFTSTYKGIPEIDAPACQGSILRWDEKRIFFTAPRGTKRENLTLWKSTDEGGTWAVDRLISAGPVAYADIVRTADGKLGVLFENGAKDSYERISFGRLEID